MCIRDRAYTVRLAGRGIFPRLAIAFGVPTGTAYVWVDEDGENSIVVAPGANALARAEVADLTPDDVLLCQLEAVSYTHLDVYKRQAHWSGPSTAARCRRPVRG